MEKRKYVAPACTVNEVELQGMLALSNQILNVDTNALNNFEGMANKNEGFSDIWGNDL